MAPTAKLERIRQNRFLVIGRAGVDVYPHPPGTRTEDAEFFQAALGGSSANIAVAIVRQGGRASLVTRVSDDALGRHAINQLAHYGVDAAHVGTVGGQARTSFAVVESRVEDHQSIIYRNGAADLLMDESDVADLAYEDFGALVITGTVFALEPSRSAGFMALEKARAAGLPVVIDLDYRPYTWASAEESERVYRTAADFCDILVGNDEEFAVMAGGDREAGFALAKQLARQDGRIVLYKMGHEGSITLTGETALRQGIFPVTALKPTGAGDAFMGNFLAAFAAGRELGECVRLGSAAAAIVVSKFACAPAMPTREELERFLADHPGQTKPDEAA